MTIEKKLVASLRKEVSKKKEVAANARWVAILKKAGLSLVSTKTLVNPAEGWEVYAVKEQSSPDNAAKRLKSSVLEVTEYDDASIFRSSLKPSGTYYYIEAVSEDGSSIECVYDPNTNLVSFRDV